MNTAWPITATHFSPFYIYIFFFCASLFISAHAYEISDNMKSGWKEVAQRSVYGLQRVNRAVTIRPPFGQLAAIVAIVRLSVAHRFGALEVSGLGCKSFTHSSSEHKYVETFSTDSCRGLGSCLSSFEYQITLPIMRSGYKDPEMYTIKNIKNINIHFFEFLD